MGPTGTGKSSFINSATGNSVKVGHDLESCTTEIGIIKCQFPERCGLDVVFVDTPGFDDTNKSDLEILEMVANWLKVTYERKIVLAGILYLHRISDNRMAGTPLKNLRMFEKLCGHDALKNIVLVTTMWDEIEDDGEEDVGSQREAELVEKFWKPMISQGSKHVRYHNTTDSAWNIIDDFLKEANERHAVLLQDEMVSMEMELRETRAGRQLFDTLDGLVKKQQNTIKSIRKVKTNQSDDVTMQSLNEEYEKTQRLLEDTLKDMRKLKIPIGKRVLRLLSTQLGLVGKRIQ
ncbi:hypothetical protein BD410DRAFT_730453 [Rickenella mellea]|uniref:AIG1-type G domain-containing protein n=1 Tax=Rickenella mellea TaxID=50990 RepID=A0A4Y7PQ31_9AGAM|nr:hypothetical protein BD410DRAFT_730453 [Rickenella mellea]